MKRIWIICLCLLCCLLFGCSSQDEVYVPTGNALTWDDGSALDTTEPEETLEQELVLAYYANKTMNPITCTDFTNRALFSLLYQSLFVVDSNYEVYPMLCSKYIVSDDMKEYEVFIVDDATFSDGTPLTIQDVYASIQAARKSKIYKGRFQYLRGVKYGPNEESIILQLGTAYENFAILLDVPIIKASEIDSERPLGSGPYYMETTATGTRLRKNTKWWCDVEIPITASSIPLVEAESATHIRDSFEFGDVGLVCANPGSDSYAAYRCDYELWDCENGIFLYISCNMDSKVFSVPAVRSALTYAIDRDALVSKYYSDFAHSATLPASPLSPYYSSRLASDYTYQPTKFIEALNNNYLSGAPIKILVNKHDTLRLRIAREIGKMLTDCGLVVEMLETTGDDYYYYLYIGNYDLYVGQTKLSATMDLTAFFATNGDMNYGKIEDASFYAMCREALANKGNYVNLHKMIADDGRLCPVLFQTYSIHATRGILTSLTPSRDNIFYYTLGKTMKDVLE